LVRAKSCSFIVVNLLLTISIKVNVPVSDVSRLLTTGDDHEVQASSPDPRSLVVAVRLWLERHRRLWLIEHRPSAADFCENSDDLRLGADRLFASLNAGIGGKRLGSWAAWTA
jgi:hypothetical protein